MIKLNKNEVSVKIPILTSKGNFRVWEEAFIRYTGTLKLKHFVQYKVHEPLLLLDEPLSALDSYMRTKLQKYLIEIHKLYQMTSILVSHNKEEILELANRVFIIEHGKIITEGNPQNIFKEQTLKTNLSLRGEVLAIIAKHSQSYLHSHLLFLKQLLHLQYLPHPCQSLIY